MIIVIKIYINSKNYINEDNIKLNNIYESEHYDLSKI